MNITEMMDGYEAMQARWLAEWMKRKEEHAKN